MSISFYFEERGKMKAVMTKCGSCLKVYSPHQKTLNCLFITKPSITSRRDSLEEPACPYKIQPWNQGKLLWIAGTPGSGKSTVAQEIARRKGYVYYEGDCFHQTKNPYIPLDSANPSVDVIHQKFLHGEGIEERRKVCQNAFVVIKIFKGEQNSFSKEDLGKLKHYYKHLCDDISRERRRVGGDWVIAYVAFNRELRQLIRSRLGPELYMVFLNMTDTDVEGRLRTRTRGNTRALDNFMVKILLKEAPIYCWNV